MYSDEKCEAVNGCESEREIPEELTRQYQSAHDLLEAINCLEARLSPALRPSDPRPEAEKKLSGVSTELAARARETRMIVDGCASRLRDLTERLGI